MDRSRGRPSVEIPEGVAFWFGGVTDSELAKLSGFSKYLIRLRRGMMGIPPARLHHGDDRGVERKRRMCDALLKLQNLEKVSKRFGVTGEAVRLVVKREGLVRVGGVWRRVR